jgi:group I intron endonuclease
VSEVCGIYKITNQETGECYIGQAKDIRKRWNDHCRAGVGIDTPQGNKLYKAMQEYGLEHFSFELLEECSPDKLNEKEHYFIELYSSDTLGYNSNKGVK